MIRKKSFSSWAVIIAVICVIVFIIQQFLGSFENYFVLISDLVWIRPWTLITHAFLHGNTSHLLYNMFALVLFGIILERIIGSKWFLILYASAGLAAGLVCLPFYDACIGASGAIFGILGMLAVLRPKMIVWVFGFPMPMALAAVFWGLGDLVGLFVPSGTANAAHLAGLAIGVGFGIYFYKFYGESKHKKKSDIKISDEAFDDWEHRWMYN